MTKPVQGTGEGRSIELKAKNPELAEDPMHPNYEGEFPFDVDGDGINETVRSRYLGTEMVFCDKYVGSNRRCGKRVKAKSSEGYELWKLELVLSGRKKGFELKRVKNLCGTELEVGQRVFDNYEKMAFGTIIKFGGGVFSFVHKKGVWDTQEARFDVEALVQFKDKSIKWMRIDDIKRTSRNELEFNFTSRYKWGECR